ncbi:MAG: helix-turn-helix domain-containing protein [Pseudonocardiaceae bacterium]
MPLPGQHRDRSLTASRREWLRVREYLQQHRHELGQAVAGEYADVLKVEGTSLLSRPDWLPSGPIPLEAIDLEFAPDTPFTGLTGTASVTVALCPQRPDGSRYPSYAAAMADLTAPAVFENCSTYRLLNADLPAPRGRLMFGRGTYFDGIDVGEAAAHEYAAGQREGTDTPLRAAIGHPCDPARRPMNLAISTLTIRHDPDADKATFLLHWRDPAKVGHAGGLCMVVPVGIFQASDDQPGNERNDFSLWRCMVREYAEELLGESENHGSGHSPLDYAAWPFAARMTDALHTGRIRAHVLGMGVDPLTFATDLLTVVVFDAALFDELFADLVHTNAEGRLVGAAPSRPLEGFPLTIDPLLCTIRYPLQAAGAATLNLVRRHRCVLRLPHR